MILFRNRSLVMCLGNVHLPISVRRLGILIGDGINQEMLTKRLLPKLALQMRLCVLFKVCKL